jgi:hypothetical protein
MPLGDAAPEAAAFVAAAAARKVPVTVFESSQPDLVHAYEKPLVLARPDGHVAWRGDAFSPDLGGLVDTVRGDTTSGDVPRPEVGFGQRGVSGAGEGGGLNVVLNMFP